MDEDGDVIMDGGLFVEPRGKWQLSNSPINFLKVLMTKIRGDCEGAEKTHMGKLLDGVLLDEREFE